MRSAELLRPVRLQVRHLLASMRAGIGTGRYVVADVPSHCPEFDVLGAVDQGIHALRNTFDVPGIIQPGACCEGHRFLLGQVGPHLVYTSSNRFAFAMERLIREDERAVDPRLNYYWTNQAYFNADLELRFCLRAKGIDNGRRRLVGQRLHTDFAVLAEFAQLAARACIDGSELTYASAPLPICTDPTDPAFVKGMPRPYAEAANLNVIDERIRDLVAVLNVPGIVSTYACCEGHRYLLGQSSPYIAFVASSCFAVAFEQQLRNDSVSNSRRLYYRWANEPGINSDFAMSYRLHAPELDLGGGRKFDRNRLDADFEVLATMLAPLIAEHRSCEEKVSHAQ